MLNLIKKINLTKKLLTIAEMLSMLKIQNLTKKLKIQKEDVYLKNDLFVTAGEVAQDLGISKPFAYKLVRQMNEELEAKGFITIGNLFILPLDNIFRTNITHFLILEIGQ